MITFDEFKKLCSDYNLYEYDSTDLGYGFFIKSDTITFLNQAVIMFIGSKSNGKLKIYYGELNDDGMIPYSTSYIIVSEVSTAKYYLNVLVKKRKDILIKNRLKEIDNDFS